jgi:hypothetical protein
VPDDDDDRRLGSSGVFQAIVTSARRIKRALSESDQGLSPDTEDLATSIAQAFVSGRFADVYALGTPHLRERTAPDRFVDSWQASVRDRGPLTGFKISDAGRIDLHYIPGLEDVPQEQFVAFIELVFSSPEVPLEHENAFVVGVVLLASPGGLRIGAIHTR